MDSRLRRLPNSFGKTSYEYRLNARKRVHMHQVDPRTVMVSFKNAAERASDKGPTFLVTYEDEPRDTGSLFKWAALKAKAMYDSQRKFENFWTDDNVRRIGRGISKSTYFIEELKRVFQKESICYSDQELPRISRWIHDLETFPDPDKIKQRAMKKSFSLTDEDVTKVYWGLHTLQTMLSEILKRSDRTEFSEKD